MSSPEAAWVRGLDLPFADQRFGIEVVDRLLCDGREHAEPPRLDDAGRLVAALVCDRRAAAPRRPFGAPPPSSTSLRVRLREGALEVSCACSPGRAYVCEHVMRLLVDVAVSPPLREALAAGEPVPSAALAELAARRSEAHELRTLDGRLALWLPARAFELDLEIDVEPVRRAGLAAADERPALLVRHRRPPSRALCKPRDVLLARLPPRHRRLVELTAPSHTERGALVSLGAQASMLLHLLREESPIFTAGYRSRLRFSASSVTPRVERSGERLVARWFTEDGQLAAEAAEAMLFTGPFAYLWSEPQQLFFPVGPRVDLDVAWGLSRVPSLPLTAATAARIGRALFTRGGGLGVAFPPPQVFGLPALEPLSFELVLTGSPLDVRGELFAVYRDMRVRVAPSDPALEDGRSREAEERALARVREAGLSPDLEGGRADDGSSRATDERAVALWLEGLEALRREESPRIAVVVAESLARVRVGPPVEVAVEVGIASGWLETTLTFTASALSVELGRLRAVLAAGGRWIALSDGTLARIGAGVAALVDESATLLDERGRGRLAPHQLGRVGRWIERHGGREGEGVSALRARLRALGVNAEPAMPRRFEVPLRPYQREALAWLQFLSELGAGGVLADDMGLGKTLMTLAFLARERDARGGAPSLVVCPTSVVGGWVREAARAAPELRVLVLHGPARASSYGELEACDLVITTFAVLRRDIARLAAVRFRAAVVDEAQNLKNAFSATARAARRLVADVRLALSGTPVENRLGELRSIMSFVNPGLLGTSAEFERRFGTPIPSDPDGAAAEELRALIRPFVLRRTKAEVLAELPPKTEVERACVLGYRQRRLYDALSLTLRESVKKASGRRGLGAPRLSVLTAILRLRQMACDPRLVDPALSAADSSKRAVFLELVKELVAQGRRALVFSQFVELFALWRLDLDREKIAYEYLDGGSTDRDAIVDRFQRGSTPLFLVSLKAGGAGLNLTAADTVIHCDPWWNPAVEDQASDRAHRIGQARPVTVIRLVAVGTIEDKIGALKERKRELGAAVLGGPVGEGALGGLAEADVELLLGGLPPAGEDLAPSGAPAEEPPMSRRRFVLEREIDELRALLRRVESRGTPRADLARKVGLPVARVTLLLIGHRVPIPTEAAARIRALAG